MSSRALFKKEFTEQWRTSKVLIMAASFFFLGMSGPVTTRLLPEILKNSATAGLQITFLNNLTATDYALSFFKQMLTLPVLILILLAMGTVAGERERGTNIFVLTKPVSRSQFIVIKYLSYLVVLAGVISFTALAAVYYTLLLSTSGSLALGPFGLVTLALFSYMALILAIVVLCSTLLRTSVAAGGAAFLIYLVVTIGGSLLPQEAGKYLPQNFMNQAGPVLLEKIPGSELAAPTGAGLALSAAVIALACFCAEKREM